MTAELILTNARIVTPETVVQGTLVVRDGLIAAVESGRSAAPTAVDLGGDWLLPGLVELHTDNLERQFSPRPGVRWPGDAALIQHDSQVAAAGITTVCDAVCIGIYGAKTERQEFLRLSLAALAHARAADALRVEHRLHLRLEVADPDCVAMFEPIRHEPSLAMVSFMDHTPGQRQWHDIAKYKRFHMGRTVATDAEFDALIERRVTEQKVHAAANMLRLLELLEGSPAVRASHDDTTIQHVADAQAMGVTVSEFPTTMAAARAARNAGQAIVMGAPNLVLGGSHSGNVAGIDLVREGLLEVLSSDYVPASLVQAAFRLHQEEGVPMPDAIRPITLAPARVIGLDDRGALVAGLRGDLVRVREVGTTPAVTAVWRGGQRVA